MTPEELEAAGFVERDPLPTTAGEQALASCFHSTAPGNTRPGGNPMRPCRRAILERLPGRRDPALPRGLTVIDRRIVSRSAGRPGEVAHQVEELLVAGDALPEVPEMCEPQRLTLDELYQAARRAASR